MFTVSLPKELSRLRKRDLQAQEALLSQANQILTDSANEELELLKLLAPNSGSQGNFMRLSIVNEQKGFEATYSRETYTKAQIEELAIKYKLRFLPSSHFKGQFDHLTGSKLKAFFKEHDLNPKGNQVNFYLLAPAENFTLTPFKHEYAVERRRKERELDPVLFYKIPGRDLFVIIHKWGNDFSVFRYIEGLRWRSFWSRLSVNTLLVLPVAMCLLALWAGLENVYQHWAFLSILSFFTSFIFSYYRWSYRTHDEGKAVKEFFSPENWNKTYIFK